MQNSVTSLQIPHFAPEQAARPCITPPKARQPDTRAFSYLSPDCDLQGLHVGLLFLDILLCSGIIFGSHTCCIREAPPDVVNRHARLQSTQHSMERSMLLQEN